MSKMSEKAIDEMNRPSVVDKCFSWINYWGNGGGCLSLETWIKDKLEELDEKDSAEEILKYLLDNSPDYGCDNVYNAVVKTMVEECKGEK